MYVQAIPAVRPLLFYINTLGFSTGPVITFEDLGLARGGLEEAKISLSGWRVPRNRVKMKGTRN